MFPGSKGCERWISCSCGCVKNKNKLTLTLNNNYAYFKHDGFLQAKESYSYELVKEWPKDQEIKVEEEEIEAE